MNSPLPQGLSQAIREAALPIRDKLVAAGWTFGVIHWDNENQRTLSFSAKSPAGASVYVACEESALTRKLQDLISN
jgi:hypothetical protein